MCLVFPYNTQQQNKVIAIYLYLHCTWRWTIPLNKLPHAACCWTYVTGPDALCEKIIFFLLTEHTKTPPFLPLHYTLFTHSVFTHTNTSLLVWPQSDPFPVVAVTSQPSNWALAWKVLLLAGAGQLATKQIGLGKVSSPGCCKSWRGGGQSDLYME